MAAVPRCHKGWIHDQSRTYLWLYTCIMCMYIYIYTHIAICIHMHNLDIVIKTTQRCMWIWHNMTQEDLDNFGHVCWKNVDIFQAALLSSATKVSKELQEKIQASSLPYLGMVNPEIVMIYISPLKFPLWFGGPWGPYKLDFMGPFYSEIRSNTLPFYSKPPQTPLKVIDRYFL